MLKTESASEARIYIFAPASKVLNPASIAAFNCTEEGQSTFLSALIAYCSYIDIIPQQMNISLVCFSTEEIFKNKLNGGASNPILIEVTVESQIILREKTMRNHSVNVNTIRQPELTDVVMSRNPARAGSPITMDSASTSITFVVKSAPSLPTLKMVEANWLLIVIESLPATVT